MTTAELAAKEVIRAIEQASGVILLNHTPHIAAAIERTYRLAALAEIDDQPHDRGSRK